MTIQQEARENAKRAAAIRAVRMIETSGSASVAAHELSIGIEAVRPLTDKNAEYALQLVKWVADVSGSPERVKARMETLRQLA